MMGNAASQSRHSIGINHKENEISVPVETGDSKQRADHTTLRNRKKTTETTNGELPLSANKKSVHFDNRDTAVTTRTTDAESGEGTEAPHVSAKCLTHKDASLSKSMFFTDEDGTASHKKDEDHTLETISSRSTFLDVESLHFIMDSTKSLIQEEFERQQSINSMFQLYNDTYSFLLTCKFRTFMFMAAFFVYSLQMTLYGLALASATDFEDSHNPLKIPANVEPSVTAAQFLAIGIAIIVQDSLRECLFMIENFGVLLDEIPGNKTWKMWTSFVMKFSKTLLSSVLILVLICQKDDVIELLMDFAALLFVSSLDNIVFRIGQEGYLGRHFRAAVLQVRSVRFATSGRKRFKVILRTSVMGSVYISLLVPWIILCPVRQGNGYYLADTALVQFPSGSSDASLSFFTGVYKLDKERVHDRRISYVENNKASSFHQTSSSRRRAQRSVFASSSIERYPAYFAYCKSLAAWVFVAGSESDNSSPCSQYKAISSEYLGYELLHTADLTWYLSDNAREPIQDFFLQQLNDKTDSISSFGLRDEFDPPCPKIQLDELKGELRSTRRFASQYEILRHQNGEMVEVYTRPVFFNNNSWDIILYTGSNWILTGASFLYDRNLNNKDITEYLTDEFHSFWSTYDAFLVTETIIFSSEKDAATPVGLDWFIYNLQTRQADETSPIDAILVCSICDGVKNPCSHQGECQADGQCRCTTGSSGVLCQVPPVSNGVCDPFFNTLAFDWDGGDCCKSTCKMKGNQACGRDTEGLFTLDFVQCRDPDLFLCATMSLSGLCWKNGGESIFGETNQAEAGFSVAVTESVLVLGEPGSSSVRVFDRYGSEFIFRDLLPNDGTGNRFGTSVSVASSDKVYASASRLTKPVVAATSSSGVLKVFDWSYEKESWSDISPDFVAWSKGDTALLEARLLQEGKTLVAFEYSTQMDASHLTVWEKDNGRSQYELVGNFSCNCTDFSMSEDGEIMVTSHSYEHAATLYLFDQSTETFEEQGILKLHGTAKVIHLSKDGRVLATLGFTDGNPYRKELCLFDRTEQNPYYIPRKGECIRVLEISTTQRDTIDLNEDGSLVTLVTKDTQVVNTYMQTDDGLWHQFEETIKGRSAAMLKSSELFVGNSVDNTAGSNRGVVSVFGREETFCESDDVLVAVSINFDQSPEETWWQLYDPESELTLVQHGPFQSADAFLVSKHSNCVPQEKCLMLLVFDTNGNGMSPPAQYSVHINGSLVAAENFAEGLVSWINIGPGNECDESMQPPSFLSSKLYKLCGDATCSWQQAGSDMLGEQNGDLFGTVTSLSNDGRLLVASGRGNDFIWNGTKGDGVVRSFAQAFLQTETGEWNQMGGTIMGSTTEKGFGVSLEVAGDAQVFVVGSTAQTGFSQVYEFNNTEWIQKGSDIAGMGHQVAISADGNMIATSGILSGLDSMNNSLVTNIYQWNEGDKHWAQFRTLVVNVPSFFSPSGLSLSGNGQVVAFSSLGADSQHIIDIYEFDNNKREYAKLGKSVEGEKLSLSFDGHTLASQADSDYSQVWRYVSGSWVKLGKHVEHSGPIDLSNDGSVIVMGDPDKQDGHAFVYHYIDQINQWAQLGSRLSGAEHQRSTYRSNFGSSVSIDQDGLRISSGELGFDADPNLIDVNKVGLDVGRVRCFDFLPTDTGKSVNSNIKDVSDCSEGDSLLEIEVILDDFPADTYITLHDSSASSLLQETYEFFSPGDNLTNRYCIDLSKMPRFDIHDRFHNGLCCTAGAGGYKVFVDGDLIQQGAEFRESEASCLAPDTCPLDITLSALEGTIGGVEERLVEFYSDGSMQEFWNENRDFRLEMFSHRSCVSTNGCQVYSFTEGDHQLATEIVHDHQKVITASSAAKAFEPLHKYFSYRDTIWFGNCQETLCSAGQSVLQLSFKDKHEFTHGWKQVCDPHSVVEVVDLWRVTNSKGEVSDQLKRQKDVPATHYWTCAPDDECLTFSLDWELEDQGQRHISYLQYLHLKYGSFSLWSNNQRVVTMDTAMIQFPKVYQLKSCLTQQCHDGYALFQLHADVGVHPSSVWSVYGSNNRALVTHGFTKNDSNTTYNFSTCLPTGESFLFAAVLGSGVHFKATWDGVPLEVGRYGLAQFGVSNRDCPTGMVPLAKDTWIPRSSFFENCDVVCDIGYSLLHFHVKTRSNVSTSSWNIFSDHDDVPIWTHQFQEIDASRDFDYKFCMPQETLHFFYVIGNGAEYNATWNGLSLAFNHGFAQFGDDSDCDNGREPFSLLFQIIENPDDQPPSPLIWKLQDKDTDEALIEVDGSNQCTPSPFYFYRQCVPEGCYNVDWKYQKDKELAETIGPKGLARISFANETFSVGTRSSFKQKVGNCRGGPPGSGGS